MDARGAVHWVTPPGGRRPRRVEVLGDFLAEKLSSGLGSKRPLNTCVRRNSAYTD